MHRQTAQALTLQRRENILTGEPSELPARRRTVQRNVVKYTLHAMFLHIRNEFRALLEIPQLDVEDMRIVRTVFRNDG